MTWPVSWRASPDTRHTTTPVMASGVRPARGDDDGIAEVERNLGWLAFRRGG